MQSKIWGEKLYRSHSLLKTVAKNAVLLLVCLSSLLLFYPLPGALGQNSKSTVDAAALLDRGQILLRNYYLLKDGRKSAGASAFLIEREGEVRAITAKHLLGPAMGIDPAVKPTDFDHLMKYWMFFIPGDDEPVAAVIGIVSPDDNSAIDFIELSPKPLDQPEPVPSLRVLDIAESTPKAGDRLYLIGCPYAENDCVQNVYPGSALSVSKHRITMTLDRHDFSLSGFSGAPVLNSRGNVVGLLQGGGGGKVTLQSLSR